MRTVRRQLHSVREKLDRSEVADSNSETLRELRSALSELTDIVEHLILTKKDD